MSASFIFHGQEQLGTVSTYTNTLLPLAALGKGARCALFCFHSYSVLFHLPLQVLWEGLAALGRWLGLRHSSSSLLLSLRLCVGPYLASCCPGEPWYNPLKQYVSATNDVFLKVVGSCVVSEGSVSCDLTVRWIYKHLTVGLCILHV